MGRQIDHGFGTSVVEDVKSGILNFLVYSHLQSSYTLTERRYKWLKWDSFRGYLGWTLKSWGFKRGSEKSDCFSTTNNISWGGSGTWLWFSRASLRRFSKASHTARRPWDTRNPLTDPIFIQSVVKEGVSLLDLLLLQLNFWKKNENKWMELLQSYFWHE